MAKLIFILDDEQEIVVPLPQQVTIGRQDGNDVVVDDPRISSRHAVVTKDRNGNFEMRDLGSKAGTFVNGVRMDKRVLQPGDQLNFGPLRCRFIMESPERRGSSSGGNHKVLNGVLDATPGTLPEDRGPRLTGNVFSASEETIDPRAPAPGGREAGARPPSSGAYVTPRTTQPHSSVTPPRSPYDEPRERPAASGAGSGVGFNGSPAPSSRGKIKPKTKSPGVFKSFLRSMGAYKDEAGDSDEPVVRNTVAPRQPPGRTEDPRRNEASQSHPPAVADPFATQTGRRPMAGLGSGPMPKEVPTEGPGPDENGAIERVPVYTYAVQPKAKAPAPAPPEPELDLSFGPDAGTVSEPVAIPSPKVSAPPAAAAEAPVITPASEAPVVAPAAEVPLAPWATPPPSALFAPVPPAADQPAAVSSGSAPAEVEPLRPVVSLPPVKVAATPAAPVRPASAAPSGLSPLPPMPAGMMRPPLPPLPPLPAVPAPFQPVAAPVPASAKEAAAPAAPVAPKDVAPPAAVPVTALAPAASPAPVAEEVAPAQSVSTPAVSPPSPADAVEAAPPSEPASKRTEKIRIRTGEASVPSPSLATAPAEAKEDESVIAKAAAHASNKVEDQPQAEAPVTPASPAPAVVSPPSEAAKEEKAAGPAPAPAPAPANSSDADPVPGAKPERLLSKVMTVVSRAGASSYPPTAGLAPASAPRALKPVAGLGTPDSEVSPATPATLQTGGPANAESKNAPGPVPTSDPAPAPVAVAIPAPAPASEKADAEAETEVEKAPEAHRDEKVDPAPEPVASSVPAAASASTVTTPAGSPPPGSVSPPVTQNEKPPETPAISLAAEPAKAVSPAPAPASAPSPPVPLPESPPPQPHAMDAQRAQVSQLVKDLEGKQSTLMQSLRLLTDRKHATQADMDRMLAEIRRSVSELEGLKTQIGARQEELLAIDKETQTRHSHLTQLAAEQQRLAPVTAALREAEARHQELGITLQALAEQRESRQADLVRVTEEIQSRSATVTQLQEEERRLAQVTAALTEGEGRYNEMVLALQALAEQHDNTHSHLKTVAEEVQNKTERIAQLAAQDDWYVQSLAHRQTELVEAEQKLSDTLESIKQGVERNEELVRGLQNLDDTCGQRQIEFQQINEATAAAGQELEAAQARVSETEAQLQSLVGECQRHQDELKASANELESQKRRLDDMKSDELRLQLEIETLKERELAFQGAANDAESKHAGWLVAIQALGVQHDQKQAEIQRLHTASEAALRELEAMTSNKEQMSVHLLSLLKEQEAIDSRLAHLRKQSDEAEARAATLKALVESREDEARQREKVLVELEDKRSSLEGRITALAGTEEKLLAAKQKLEETNALQVRTDEELAAVQARLKTGEGEAAELDARIADLRQRLEGLHVEITESRANLARDQQHHDEFLTVSADARAKQESYREALDKQLETLRGDLAKESQRLAETMAEREELDRQCSELADTGRQLAETTSNLNRTEAERVEVSAWLKDLHSKRDALEQIVGGLTGDEESTKARVEVLRGREKDLRKVLDELSTRERSERERFEAIRRLTAEADKEHNEQREALHAKLDGKRRELADLEMKLTPLREWKECMDIRYARLATLPEDSTEARELWKEIEAEKSNLRNLITGSPGGTRGVSLSESVLRGLAGPSAAAIAADSRGVDDSAPAGNEEADHTEDDSGSKSGKSAERPHRSTPGTGAMVSGTGQEMALKARVSRLRESVQREATRLEFLRQERSREEMRSKSGAVGEPMLREQDRQLETKIRRDEERLATLQRKLELAEVEEEKRRDRITEMERKIAELKSDVIEAERERTAARHRAELAQAELRSHEDHLDRQTRPEGGVDEGTSVLASLLGGKKGRQPSNLKPMGTPKE